MPLPGNPPATTTPAAFKTWAQNVVDTLNDIIDGTISIDGDDAAYDATSWNGALQAPSKNAVRDAIENLRDGFTATGDIVVPDEVYGAGWNGSLEVPTKNAVYDKIETIGGGGGSGTVVSASATLTQATPNSTTFQQWGTEEAVVAQVDAPSSAVVLAWLSGQMRPGPGTPAVADRGTAKLQVSFDGGGSFSDLGVTTSGFTLPITNTSRNYAVALTGRATGTVTGDIQVRAMVADIDQANDTQWINGGITVLVHE